MPESPATTPKRRVSIVPHTHWDREWYQPFQAFRMRLVAMLDEFLPRLESDLSYARFLLDGQMAVVDDYLEIRPEEEARLRRLAGSGRLAMGPWYTLPDEFLVSGETLVRNLQRGIQRATAFGGTMMVGYLPDMFGHVAQMPQIFRQLGMEHAVVWRGVPLTMTATAFDWSSPDGSTVRAEYLRHGYGNGAYVPDDAKALLRRLDAHREELGDALTCLDQPERPAGMLFMNGTDHQAPQPWLGRVVAETNDLQDEYELVVTSLAEYLEHAPREGLPAWQGELRSGARANLLMGVASNRVDVKQAAAIAERALERRAEPLCAFFLAPERWPQSFFDVAWTEMFRNAAHDSVCACSVDEVVDAVLHRYAEARQIADGLSLSALKALAATMPHEGSLIVNTSMRTRGGVVEVTIAGEDPVPGTQVLKARPSALAEMNLKASALGGILGQIRSQQLDNDTFVNRVEVEEDETGLDIVLHAESRLRSTLLVEEIKRDLYARIGGRPDLDVRVRIRQPGEQRVLAWVEDVPGFGWAMWDGSAGRVEPVRADATDGEASGAMLDNGLVRVDVNGADGTFAIDGVAGLGRIVDDGDHGDTYNYSPPANDTVVDRPEQVSVRILERGPLRARVEVTAGYEWPERVDDGRRARVGSVPVTVTTLIELRAGERFVRVTTRFENRCRDHRVRAWFPLPAKATSSAAECAFAIVERGLEAEGGRHERGLPTFPSRRFVAAGGLTVAHEGLLEYEVVDGGAALAITLLRATGMLSRVEMAYRPLPAGPPIAMEGPQMIGPVECRYVVQIGDGDPYALADAFLPLEVVQAHGTGAPGTATGGRALSVEGAEVSAVVRGAGALEVRVFNPSPEETTVVFDGCSGWLVDLRGQPVGRFDGSFPLGPWRIATARVTSGA